VRDGDVMHFKVQRPDPYRSLRGDKAPTAPARKGWALRWTADDAVTSFPCYGVLVKVTDLELLFPDASMARTVIVNRNAPRSPAALAESVAASAVFRVDGAQEIAYPQATSYCVIVLVDGVVDRIRRGSRFRFALHDLAHVGE